MFDHEKLDVYHLGMEFAVAMEAICEGFPRGHGKMIDQLRRAAMSIPLNIAEGAGRFGDAEKSHFYRIARGSALECAAVLDFCYRVDLISEGDHLYKREQLLQVVRMLTGLIKRRISAAG